MKRVLLLLIPGLLLCSCNPGSKESTTQAKVVGLCSPIQLQIDSTVVFLEDYFLNYAEIDSVLFPNGLHSTWEKGTDKIALKGNIDQSLDVLNFYFGEKSTDIPVKRARHQKVDLKIEAPKVTYNSLKIKGSFNAWNSDANPLTQDGDYFTTSITLLPGDYEYVLILDGADIPDPSNPEKISNGMGGFNSVLKVAEIGDDPGEIFSSGFTDSTIRISATADPGVLLAFWQNELLPAENFSGTWEIRIPAYATEHERSFVRVYAGNEGRLCNDLLIPLHKGKVVSSTSNLNRDDWEASIMYFLMIDRFKNGNPDNDSMVPDPEVHPKVNYFGGDVAGITQSIEAGYFDNLGMNTIWISPVTQNPWDAWGYWDKGGVTTKFSGYHGYWPISNIRPDTRFGSREEVIGFLDMAHSKQYNVLLDYVANHVHQQHPIYQQNKEWATDLYLPDGTMNTERWDDHRLTTWFDTFMPTLDLRRPEIIDPMTDSALVWLLDYEFDGFRHDATKHIDELFWRQLTKKVKEQVAIPRNRRVFQVGETYGSPELINSYISSGMLDAQFDFNLYDAAVSVFVEKNASFHRLAAVLNSSLNWYGHHHLMGNISGNQDRPRFISLASGDIFLSEDTKLAGWTREIPKPQPDAYRKLALLHAFNFSIPGIPVIYYGDEYGSWGGNDPDNRKMMKFEAYDRDEQFLIEKVKELTALRKQSMALLYGTTKVTVLNDDVMVIHRSYFDEQIWMVLNKGNKDQVFALADVVGVNLAEKVSTLDSSTDISIVSGGSKDKKISIKPLGFGLLMGLSH